MKSKPISEQTRTAILNATWSLMEEKNRLDVGQAEIAAAAGVSRQTVYLAFGGRTGLLTAMVRNKDEQSDHVIRLATISQKSDIDPQDMRRYLETWLDYLPLIYPVGILLDAASLTDKEAAAAWDDRMKGALLAGFKRICRKLEASGHLREDMTPDQAAEFLWTLVHPVNWRLLVVECGWSAEMFRRTRIEAMEALFAAQPGAA